MNQAELKFILRMRDEATAILRNHSEQLKATGRGAAGTAAEGKKAALSLNDLARAAKDAAAAVAGIYTSGKMVRGAYNSFTLIESGIVQVAKTTGLAGKSLDSFSDGLREMSRDLRGIGTGTLLDIAATAGQLGIHGEKNLLSFTDTMAKLGVATDVVGDEGAKSVARLLQITGDGIGKVKQFGNTLNYLGNMTAASESEILRMASRVGQSTTQFNLGTTAVLGLSAAMAALDIMPERGGTAMGRVLLRLRDAALQGGEAMDALAAITGRTQEQFTQLIRNDPVAALTTFLEALRRIEASGQSTTGFLEEFKLQGIDVQAVLGTLASNIDLVKQKQKEAKEGARSNSLEEEYGAAAKAIAAAMDNLGNRWTLLKEQLFDGILPIVKAVTAAMGTAFDTAAAALKALPGPIKLVVASAVFLAPAIGGAAAALRILTATLLPGLKHLGLLAVAFRLVQSAVGRVVAVFKGLGAGVRLLLGLGAAAKGLVGFFVQARLAIALAAGVIRSIGVVATIARVAMAAFAVATLPVSGVVLGVAAAVTAVVGAVYAFRKEIKEFLADKLPSWMTGKDKVEFPPMIDSQAWEDAARETVKVVRFLSTESKEALRELYDRTDQQRAIEQQKKALQQLREVMADPHGRPTGYTEEDVARIEGLIREAERLLDPVRARNDELRREAELAGAGTEAERHRLAVAHAILDEERKLGFMSDAQKKEQRELLDLAQQRRDAVEIEETLRDYERQAEAARAVTAEEKNRLEIAHALADMERERAFVEDKDRKALAARIQALQQARKAAAFEETIRDLRMQAAQTRALTRADRNRLDILQRLADFQREHGRLSADRQRQIAALMADIQQTGQFRSLRDSLDPVAAATRIYTDDLKTLRAEFERGAISGEEYARLLARLNEISLDTRDPIRARIRDMREEIAVAGLVGRQQVIERQVLSEINELRRRGVAITDELTEAVREYATAMSDADAAGSNGIQGWMNAVETLEDGIASLQKNAVGGLSDAITDAITGQEGSFREFGRNIGRQMVKFAVDQQLKGALEKVMPNPQKEALGRADAALAKLDALSSAGINAPQAVVNAGTVTLNGANLGALIGAPGSGPSILGAANDNRMGALASLGDPANDIDKAVASATADAVDRATSLLGAHENRNRGQVNAFLRQGGVDIDAAQTAWCAAFVNSALQQVGVDGSGKLTASSFLDWGQKIDPSEVMKGDVLVDHRGRRPGEVGAHVGFATGATRMGPRGLELQMVSGNASDQVKQEWHAASQLEARRAGLDQAQQQLQQLAQTAQMAAPQLGQAGSAMGSFLPELDGFEQGLSSLLGPLSQAIPGLDGFGGALMGLTQMLAGGGMGGGMGGFGMMLGGLFHEGGKVGHGIPASGLRMLPASAWANAVRHHDGLGTDEYPSILKRGERVLTANDNARTEEVLKGMVDKLEGLQKAGNDRDARRAGPTHFNQTIQVVAQDASSFRKSEGQLMADSSVKMRRMAARNS